ncbi:MAG: cytochrome oxidase subunit III, partial [Flavobacteriales bacterium]|nr:cytochrome oxidase subunit III [Flavobacteriales bacterium]
MAGNTETIPSDVLWGGGQSPYSVTYGKMMMWFFLVSDALTFGGLLTAYGFSRATSEDAWPIGEQVFRALPGLEGAYPLVYVALMTFLLIVSSVTMVLAVEAGHRNDKRGVVRWMAATVVGGIFFLGSQAWEWSHFIHGSGGSFQLAKAVNVTTDSGMSMELPQGEVVFMDHHFGHLAEPWSEGDPNTVLSSQDGHVTLTQFGEHEHSAQMHGLTVNKYIENEQQISGEEALKLWSARGEVFAFGANLEDSEYAAQQTYANFFFFITGFHGFHVFSGVVINII